MSVNLYFSEEEFLEENGQKLTSNNMLFNSLVIDFKPFTFEKLQGLQKSVCDFEVEHLEESKESPVNIKLKRSNDVPEILRTATLERNYGKISLDHIPLWESVTTCDIDPDQEEVLSPRNKKVQDLTKAVIK